MECNVRFEMSDQLLQHLDTHQYFRLNMQEDHDDDADHNNENVCTLCPYSLKKASDTMSLNQIKEAMMRHTILEHFRGKLRTSDQAPDPDPIIDHEETFEQLVFKCTYCTRTFDQLYQRRIHERYNHLDSLSKDAAQMKKFIKCPTCKTLCKDEKQFSLHKELYCDVGFECKQCSEKFLTIGLLATHMKIAHGAVTGANTREIFVPITDPGEEEADAAAASAAPTRLKCVLCSVEQFNARDLYHHLIGRHNFDVTSLKPVQCDKCPLRASDIKVFADHYRKHLMK